MPFVKKTQKKKKATLVFWKKDQDNKNILYTDRDLGDELWLLSSSTTVIAVYLSFPKEVAISKKILSTKKKGVKGKDG